MRKLYIIMAVVAIAFSSCKKDENDAPAANTTKDPIAEKLLDFKQTIQSQNKEAVLYTTEDAEWHLEGLLNYEEANNEHNWHGLDFENRTFEVPVSNGQISSSDLYLAYESFLAEINSLLAEDENLRSDMVNIEIEENQMKDGTATIGMTYGFGSIIAIPNYNPFGQDEYWVWGDPDGYGTGGWCGLDTNLSTDYANDRLQDKFNNPTTTSQPGYYTSVTTIPRDAGYYSEDPNHPNPSRPFIIFWDDNADWEECLPPTELNYYLSKFDYIKQDVQPLNKTFASVQIDAHFLTGAKGTILQHVYYLSFGIFHPGSGGGTD